MANNTYTQRLIQDTQQFLDLFIIGKLTEQELSSAIGAIIPSVDNPDLSSTLSSLLVSIDDSLHLYDIDEGKRLLLEKIRNLQDCLKLSVSLMVATDRR